MFMLRLVLRLTSYANAGSRIYVIILACLLVYWYYVCGYYRVRLLEEQINRNSGLKQYITKERLHGRVFKTSVYLLYYAGWVVFLFCVHLEATRSAKQVKYSQAYMSLLFA